MALTSNSRFQSASEVRTSGAAIATPALLTRMSMRAERSAREVGQRRPPTARSTRRRSRRAPWHPARAMRRRPARPPRASARPRAPRRHARRAAARWRRRRRGHRRSRARRGLRGGAVGGRRCGAEVMASDRPRPAPPESLKFKRFGRDDAKRRSASGDGGPSKACGAAQSRSRRGHIVRGAVRRCRRRPIARSRIGEIGAIPQLARHLPMTLIERFAVVGERAAAHLAAEAEPDLAEPVGIGQRLARRADDVGGAGGEDRFGLVERMDAAGDDDRRVEAGVAHAPVGCARDVGDVAAERSACVARRSSACTPSRSRRCTDRRPRRPPAASHPRICRRATATGSRSRRARTPARNTTASSRRLPPATISSVRNRQPTTKSRPDAGADRAGTLRAAGGRDPRALPP